jgi:hypothetical protein
MTTTTTSFDHHGQTQGDNVIQGLTLSGGNNTINFGSQSHLRPDQKKHSVNRHWRVPRKTNSIFTGRAKLIERIKNEMRNSETDDKVFVITGLGGLGKSELCLRIAKDMRQEYAAPYLFTIITEAY